jgi:DNA repair protein RadD
MQPRWYQSESVDAVWQHLRNDATAPLVVLPTGSGKSLVLAMIAQQARRWDGRTIVLAHRKELLRQNADKIQALLPNMEVGLYSAGLNARNTQADVICAGIQSCYSKAFEFGRRDLLIVDEAHLIPNDGDGMYQQFLTDMRSICGHARLIGLTATPYRCGTGPLAGPGRMFGRICYEVGTGQLIKEGFLCELTNKPADHQTDVSAVKVRGGEFIASDMARQFDQDSEVELACSEIVKKAHDRKSIIVFCAGVAHAEHVADTLQRFTGNNVAVITGETPPMERVATLNSFSDGRLRILCNCDVLTTGFDNPRIDCVAVLRSTMSPGLFAQMVGRGLRLHSGKRECLVLDFGGNLKRHGHLDDPNYGRADFFSGGTGKAEEQNGRGKQCPNCSQDVPVQAKECLDCGFVFPVVARHGAHADTESDVVDATPRRYQVKSVTCMEHRKKNAPDAPPTLRVIYECVQEGESLEDDGSGFGNLEGTLVSEWVCFEHEGFARRKAEAWWSERSAAPVPEFVVESVELFPSCRVPESIVVIKEGRFDRITQYEWGDSEIIEEWDQVVMSLDDVPF